MCLGGAPAAPAENKPVEYLHNQYLDGATIAGAGATTNRNSLRIDLNSPTASGVATPPVNLQVGTSQTNPPDPIQRQTLQPLAPSPGMVVPTIGGSLAGTIGGAVVK